MRTDITNINERSPYTDLTEGLQLHIQKIGKGHRIMDAGKINAVVCLCSHKEIECLIIARTISVPCGECRCPAGEG